jgi:hypothetical protein
MRGRGEATIEALPSRLTESRPAAFLPGSGGPTDRTRSLKMRGAPRLADGFQFSLLRRHDAALAMGAYVSVEVRAGRALRDVLGDERVRAPLARQPELLEDLACDQRVVEAMTGGVR